MVAPYRVRLTLPEPIILVSDVTAACQRLLARLVERLAADHKGVRQLRLLCFGVDGAVRQAGIEVSRPRRDAAGLWLCYNRILKPSTPALALTC